MRAACVLLGVCVVAGAGCLSLSVTDPSTTGGAGSGMGGAGTSSSGAAGSGADGGAGGGSGGGCVSSTPCMTGKSGVCASGFLSCDALEMCVQTVQPSAERCDTQVDESCDGTGVCTGTPTLGGEYGQAGTQGGNDVAIDSQGNVLVTGAFEGAIDFGSGLVTSAGGDDIFVAKFDAAGKHIWSRRFGGASSQEGRAIAVDADDNVFIGGAIEGTVTFGNDILDASGSGEDAFIAKLDPNGNPLWANYAKASGLQSFDDIAVDPNGDVICVGLLQGSANFGSGSVTSAGEDDILVAKFSNSGANLWTRSFGNPLSIELATGVATDSTGNIYLTGYATSAIDFGGKTMSFGGDIDAFFVKLNGQGEAEWAKGFGNGNTQQGTDVATDAADDVILTITFEGNVNMGGTNLTAPSGTTDAAIAKWDATGGLIWSKQLKQTVDSTGVYVATDDVGNILVTGGFQGSIDFGSGPLVSVGNDMVLSKLDPSGNAAFAQRYGTSGSKVAPLAIAAGKLGNAWVVGTFVGNVSFGPDNLSTNTTDMFLAGFSP